METKIIRKQKNTNESLASKKLNVAAYIRVSTKLEKQTNSLDSQRKYFINKIARNKNWNLVNIYEDDGISGKSVTKRTGFMRMITDAMNGKIDLILIKSISRFGRNVVDNLRYMRLLKDKKVGIYFVEENIYTLDMSGEMLFTVFSTIYQAESQKISERIYYGLKMNSKNFGIGYFFGYRYSNKTHKYTINKNQADTVKLIFNLYLNGMSYKEIARYLEQNKYKNYHGYYKWSGPLIGRFIKNEKYLGVPLDKDSNNFGKSKKYILEPIITKEIFDKAQEKRYEKSLNNETKIIRKDETLEIRCGYCGSKFMEKNNRLYCCGNYLKYTKCVQESLISLKLFYYTFVKGLKLLFEQQYENSNEINLKNRLSKLKRLKNSIELDLSCLIDDNISNRINKLDFIMKRDNYYQTKKEIEIEIEKISKELSLISRINKIIDNIGKIILKNNYDTSYFNRNLFEEIISCLIIGDKKNRYSFRYILKENNTLFEKDKIVFNNFLDNYVIDKDEKFLKILDYRKRVDLNNFKNVYNCKNNYKYIRITFEIEKDDGGYVENGS